MMTDTETRYYVEDRNGLTVMDFDAQDRADAVRFTREVGGRMLKSIFTVYGELSEVVFDVTEE